MFYFMFFILFKSDFVVKVYGNSTLANVDDYIVQEVAYDMDKYMEYNIPQIKTTHTTTTHTSTRRVLWVNQDTETQSKTTTTLTTPPPPTEPDFKPVDYLVTISPEQMYNFIRNLQLFNKTIHDQTLLMYGEPRPDKYEYVATALFHYIVSIIGPKNLTPGTTTDPYAGSSVQTLPPYEDYHHKNTPKYYKKTSTKTQSSSTTIEYLHYDTEPGISVFTTLKPVTQRTQVPSKTLPNQHQPPYKAESNDVANKLPGQQGEQYPSTYKPDQQQPPHKAESNDLANNLPGQQEQYPSTYKPDQHEPSHQTDPGQQHTKYLSIILPDQRGNQYYPSTGPKRQDAQYLATPGQQIKNIKHLRDQPEKKLTPTERTDVTAVRQGFDYPVDPAYYDMDAVTGPRGFVTPEKDDLLIPVTTPPPPPSTEHPIVKDIKSKMIAKKQGYGTAFMQELCIILSEKNPRQSKEFYIAVEQVVV